MIERSIGYEQKISELVLSEINFPPTLDLRNREEVVVFLEEVVAFLNKNIPGFKRGAFLLVGSVSRNEASNNSDFDVVPLIPYRICDREVLKSAFTYIVGLYGIFLDGFQNYISIVEDDDFDHVKRLFWLQSMIDDNTVVLASDHEIKNKITNVLNLGKRGNLIIKDWTPNHVFDPMAPPRRFRSRQI